MRRWGARAPSCFQLLPDRPEGLDGTVDMLGRSRGAGGEADDARSDEPRALKLGGVLDVERLRAALPADLCETARVARVLAAHDDHGVDAGCELRCAVLTFLRGRANGVDDPELACSSR